MVLKSVDWNERTEPQPKARRRDPLFETSLIIQSSRHMTEMVSMAKRYFDEGRDANEVYAEFDIPRLADFLVLNRKAAAEVLALFQNKDSESKLIVSTFVALSLICVNSNDPLSARFMLGHILSKAKKEETFKPMAKLLLLTVAHMSSEISAMMGESDPALIEFGEICLKRVA